ncbi:probable serine/threonine-protein kinase SIS8 isoform X6 [Arachis hypogaea]|uniref:probable serine/threonine-protein kinase SIS8 isoform X6 n=1 Tax=Arachis hypogaea TaxID=3818 RepID=UPI000DEC0642|nr:probable serine/threonine-protein kinase SIS8 isoform X6 [Arachis hypogaea]
MEETQEDAGQATQRPSSMSAWPSDFAGKFGSVSLGSQETLNDSDSHRHSNEDVMSPHKASQILWHTGMLSEPIPNGFYSVIPEKRLKKYFDDIPTLDELQALSIDGFKADIILVDTEKDRKLSMLKQLIVTLVKGLNSNPAATIKKIAGLVSDFYKRPNAESPAKAALEEPSHVFENCGVQLLGQIRHGSCRPRAILFKVLADTVGLESRLMMGFPNDGAAECIDSYKHMSVMVVLNSVELLVDLMRFPGQLLPRSTKSIFMTHISAAGESDSAENDSCDSPLEPNSPLYGVSESVERENFQFRRKFEGSSNVSGLSLRNLMLRYPSLERKMRSSYRSDGASSSQARRVRRSVSVTPEIGDDIVRAVRAMNEALKQTRRLREHGDHSSLSNSLNDRTSGPDLQRNLSNFHGRGDSSQKAMSLPSSPHDYRGQAPERGGPSGYGVNAKLELTWNKVLESQMFNNKPLLPFEEWNIDFSELTVGTRVGIGFFGEVFRGMWNGTNVAIKVFLEQDLTAENMEDFCNEISILSRLRHPNVILFLGACTKPPRLSMVTEYMEVGSLYFLLHMSDQKKKLNWKKRLKMLRGICRGLMHIHRMKIIHRDVKSANCLVDKHWTVKICDFGLSRIVTETPMRDSSSAGTPEWMAPELIRNEPFTEKCDIFSLGVIMWELCTLSRPWEGVPPERVVYAVAHEGSRLELPEGPMGRLISDCWAEPHERPSCEEILSRLVDIEYSMS